MSGGNNMVSKQTKIFDINGVGYQFDKTSFQTFVKAYMHREEARQYEVFEIISSDINVTPEAVKQWYYGNNGPGDIDMIKQIANIFGITNYLSLMAIKKEEKQMVALSTLQIESAKRIYDAIIEFLDDFYRTDGFTGNLWYEYVRQGSKDPEQEIYEYAEAKIAVVNLILQKEYFYLRNTDLYNELSEYCDNDLWDTFNGKLSYAYRFEAIPDGNPTTDEDYNEALKKLNSIIEKYI